MNDLEEIKRIIKNFVNEAEQTKAQIQELENQRMQLANQRNEKKQDNMNYWATDINALGQKISELGNESQKLQNKLNFKFNEVKKIVDLTIDNAITDKIRKVRKMEEEKIICGYHTMIDWDKTSSEMVTALIEVRVTPQRGQGFDSIAERIYKYPEVRSVYLISGGYDLMVILEGKTLKEVSQFVTDKLSTLDSVLSTATHFILKKYTDHGTIFDQKIKDERMLVTP